MILFLEDKETRENRIDISDENIDIFVGDSKCKQQLEEFINNFDIFSKYDTIIIHESINFNKNIDIVKQVKDYCENNDKNLVIFSGNNSQPSLSHNILNITAKSLYNNINIFLANYQNKQSNILMLAYGEHWKSNILLNILESVNILIEDSDENDEFDFDEFEDDYDLLQIKNILPTEYDKLINGLEDDILVSDIKKIRDNLKQLIQDKANE